MTTVTPLKKFTFGGDTAGGNAPTSVSTNWLSYTFTRPPARLTQHGDQVFITKKVTFTCAAKIASQKMYGRVSYADGSPYGNSQSITIPVQTSAKKAYTFQGISFPLSSAAGGPLMRAWLVGPDDFYFDRNTTGLGHIVASGGKTFAGSPTGYIEYAEVADAPQALTVSRDEDDPTKVTITWVQSQDTGGVALSGYRLQWADDVDFSINRAEVALSRTTFTRTGFKKDQVYYFRVTARNEVSDHFGLKGGDWSATTTLTIASVPGKPADDFGSTSITLNYFGPTPTATAGPLMSLTLPQRMQDAIRSPDTGEYYVSQSRDPGASGQLGDTTISDVVINRVATSGALIDAMTLTDAGHGTTLAVQFLNSAVYVWVQYESAGTIGAPNDLLRIPYTAGTFTRDTVPSPQEMPRFGVDIDVQFDWLNDQVVFRSKPDSGHEAYELRKISEYLNGTDVVYSRITLPISPPVMQGFFTYEESLFRWTGAANSPTTDPPTLSQYSWLDGTLVAKFDGSGFGFDSSTGTYSGGGYEPEGASLYNVDGTAPAAYLGMTFGVYPSHTYQLFRLPLLTAAQATANANDATSGDPGGADGSGGSGLVITPVPDTSSTETVKGGLLLSKQPKDNDYAVFIMDRGGQKRLGQIAEFTTLDWDRRRSDISQAKLTITSQQVAASAAALVRMATGRSELAIFRGGQRMWEGPITSVQWARSGVTINAQDILWWLSRTVVHANYSFAGKNVGPSVEFIAGVIASELGRKEALTPPVNVIPYLHTYIEDGDAKTSKIVKAGSTNLWQLLDDMSTHNGINYTAAGRALHIWDASRAALGRTRSVTEQDFLGDPYITEYGGDLATLYSVTDGQDGLATAGAIDPFYGEIELLSQAYGETSQQILDPKTGQVVGTTITPAELLSQAERNLAGRNPVPQILNIPDNSSLDVTRAGIGLDVLIAGVYFPVQATLSGRTMSQVQKLNVVTVKVTSTGETVTISLIPASTVVDPTLGDATV